MSEAENKAAASFHARLRALRDRWLAALEEADDVKPSYEIDGMRVEWADWKLKTVQAIRVAGEILSGPEPR